MPTKRRSRSKPLVDAAKLRDLETVRLLNTALEQQDLLQIRKLAAVRGLVNSELRKLLWQRLIGIDSVPQLPEPYSQLACTRHRDSTIVKVDVQRAPFNLWADGNAAKRSELERLLNAVVNAYPGSVHYYQGLHDIGAVLLLVAGEQLAFQLLQRLVVCHLRDCTRPTLEPVMELMQLLYGILEQQDPEVAAALRAKQLQPYFGLRWLITWFAHDLTDLQSAARLFDLFMASHPLMPLYVGAMVMHSHREALLEPDLEMPELHSMLAKVQPFEHLTADQLACGAIELYKRCPPEHLLAPAGVHMATSVAAAARLEGGHWEVPAQPAASGQVQRSPRTFMRLGRQLWQQQRSKLALVTTAVSVTGIFSLWAVSLLLSGATQGPGMRAGLHW